MSDFEDFNHEIGMQYVNRTKINRFDNLNINVPTENKHVIIEKNDSQQSIMDYLLIVLRPVRFYKTFFVPMYYVL